MTSGKEPRRRRGRPPGSRSRASGVPVLTEFQVVEPRRRRARATTVEPERPRRWPFVLMCALLLLSMIVPLFFRRRKYEDGVTLAAHLVDRVRDLEKRLGELQARDARVTVAPQRGNGAEASRAEG